MASAFIQYAITRGEGVVKKSMLCTLTKKLKIVDHCTPKYVYSLCTLGSKIRLLLARNP